nr:ABC transporter substrate-binding protein [Streptomyces scabichelini]
MPEEDNKVEKTRVLRDVQGSYLAQYRANREGDNIPIRLVLANPGPDNKHGKEVADQLVAMADSEHRLRGVFGFNRSVDSTLDTIKYLTGKKIPVVGGPITSDKIDPAKLPGLAKVVPSSLDQAEALTNYLKVEPQDTFLVEDTRPGDLYAESVRDAFRAQTTENKGAKTPYLPEQFNSENVIPKDFKDMVNNLCVSRATTVYFSGRVPELAEFVKALGGRGCTDKHYTVVTLSGGSLLALDPRMEQAWAAFKLGKGIEVKYATVTHAQAWTANNPPKTGGSAADFLALRKLVTDPSERKKVGDIGPTDLADGQVITLHDAARTMIEGIRNRQQAGKGVPELEDVREAWRRLHGSSKVRGASGWICLDNDANAYNKAVAIVRLDPAPKQHIKFEKLAWPKGRPPTEECRAETD